MPKSRTAREHLFAGWSIVVIDDEEDSLEVAQVILEAYGATVYPTASAAEGLALAREKQPQFIVSDISMPVMDGWTFINLIKQDPLLRHIPIIALSANAMTSDRERALAAGFHSYVTKPLTINTFIDHLVLALSEIPETSKLLNMAQESASDSSESPG